MNVVGSVAVARTVTMFTPVSEMTCELKKSDAEVGSVEEVVPRYPAGKLALKTLAASARGLPLLRLRAAASAAPSTALDNCAFTTYARPESTARPVKSSSVVKPTAMYIRTKPDWLDRREWCLFMIVSPLEVRDGIQRFWYLNPEPSQRGDGGVPGVDLGHVEHSAKRQRGWQVRNP